MLNLTLDTQTKIVSYFSPFLRQIYVQWQLLTGGSSFCGEEQVALLLYEPQLVETSRLY